MTQCRWDLNQSYLTDAQSEVPDNFFVRVMQTVGVVQVMSLSSVRQETDTLGVEKGDFFLKYCSTLLLLITVNN